MQSSKPNPKHSILQHPQQQSKLSYDYIQSHNSQLITNSTIITSTNKLKQKNNDFNFLMQSIEREKFNTNSNGNNNSNTGVNKQNYQNNQGRYSINNKPITFNTINTMNTLNQNSKSIMAKSTIVNSFLMSKQKDKQNNRERQRQRDRDNMQWIHNKQKQNNSININNNNNINQIIESMVYKTKKYLSQTDPLLTNPTKIQQKLRKQAINTARQLIQIVSNYQQNKPTLLSMHKQKQQTYHMSLNHTSNNINLALGSNKSLSSSYHFPNGLSGITTNNNNNNNNQGSVNFIRKIQNLQQQKMHLQSLISQHERRNIKMFIKLNEGQSQQIQKYKKMLSNLYEKYKQLQKLVQKYSQKSKKLQMKLKLEQAKNPGCTKLCQLNVSQLKKKISNFEQVINQQNQCLAKAVQQIQTLKKNIEYLQDKQLQYKQKLAQLHKIQKNNKQYININRMSSPLTTYDLAKSTCSGDIVLDSSFQTKYQHNHNLSVNTNSDSHQMFSNIMIKPTTLINANTNNNTNINTNTNINCSSNLNMIANNSPKLDENMLRMLLVQANLIQQVVNK